MGRYSFLRLGDWFGKYSAALVSMLMVIVISRKSYEEPLLFSMIFSIVSFSYAFALNYYTEREADKKVGKNRVKDIPPGTAGVIFAVMIAIMLALPLILRNLPALFISLFYILMATMYSVKPPYLKARGVLSVLSQALFLAIPHFWFFISLTEERDLVLLAYLSFWLFLITAKGAIIHQLLDYDNDQRLALRTLAVAYGKDRTTSLVQGLVVVIIFYGLLGLLVFPYPYNAILFLIVAFSNPRYKPRVPGWTAYPTAAGGGQRLE